METDAMKLRSLVITLAGIREKYDAIVKECETASGRHKEELLNRARALEQESSAIKIDLGILLEDPCPYTVTEGNTNTRICAGCQEEDVHIADGTISPRNGRSRIL